VAEYARRGQLVAGRRLFEQAAALAPRDGRIRLLVDRLLGEEERLGAQARVSGDADAHFRLGIHKLEAGLYEEARAEFESALAIRPDHPGALVDLGAALQGLGRADEAIASWERAAALRPGDRTASINLASALRAGGEAERALRVLETCLREGEEHPALHYQMAETYLALGRPEDARREGEKAVRGAPENPRFRDFMRRLDGAGDR
jgi:tetratricopeptide (TPR) repeat protein